MKTFVTFILYYLRLTLFFLIFEGFLISYVRASDLPPCPSKGPFHDCFGTYVWITGSNKGDKYVGEFKDNKMHGYGTLLRALGTGFVFSGDKYKNFTFPYIQFVSAVSILFLFIMDEMAIDFIPFDFK